MLLLIHIICGFTGVSAATYRVFYTSRRAERIAFGTTGSAWISGVALVVGHPNTLGHLCIAGLVYTAAVSILLVVGKRRLPITAI